MIKHKHWDINEHATGRLKNGKPIIGATFQNGLNDIEPDGSFVPCDMSIEESTDGVTHLRAKRGRWGQMRFGDSSHPNSFLVKIKNKGLKGVSFKYTGATGESMTANNGKPLCNFDNGISIESTPYYKGVKMDIIVNDPLTAPLEYPFSVKTYGQDYAFIEENGGATLRGEDQDPIFIKPPYAIDANGDIGPVTIQYTGIVNNLITFKKVVDEAWLRQAVAPVRIDPNVTIDDDSGTLEDNLMYSAAPNNNYGGFVDMKAGNGLTELMRVILTDYSDITVTSAKFGIDVYILGAAKTIAWYKVLLNWVEGTQVANPEAGSSCWNYAQYTGLPWNTTGCRGSGTDRAVSPEGSVVISAIDSDYPLLLTTATVQDWIDNPANNHGITWQRDAGGLAETVARSSEAVTGNKPYFYMEYTEAGFNGSPFFFDGGHY